MPPHDDHPSHPLAGETTLGDETGAAGGCMKAAAKSCCTPAADRPPAPTDAAAIPVDADAMERARSKAVAIEGGQSLLGTAHPKLPFDGEGPLRRGKVKPFLIGATTVTNADFALFIERTGYVTEAERFGWSFVFHLDVPPSVGKTMGVAGLEWWRRVDGANWRDVNGPGTEAEACHPDHPVVHVSWNDATAYAAFVGGRLATEAEWEHAARGGLGDVPFPWGEAEPDDTDHQPCNIWQGEFPRHNTGRDGWRTTAPARSFEPNGYGLYNLVGNVWEWTAEPFRIASLKRGAREQMKARRGYKLAKGGSFLCHRSYCYRYRIAARTGNSPDSTTTHQGFRVVWPQTG